MYLGTSVASHRPCCIRLVACCKQIELPEEEESGDDLGNDLGDDDDDGSDDDSYFDAGFLCASIPIKDLYLEKEEDVSTRGGRLALIRRMLTSMDKDDAYGRVYMLDKKLLEGICAVFELNNLSKRLPKRGFDDLVIKALSHLMGDESISLPISDLQEKDLLTVPASKGTVTETVHGITMIPADLELYKPLIAEYTGCPINEVRFILTCTNCIYMLR
jgi:hypothetical protein